jgi:hypothetical protein
MVALSTHLRSGGAVAAALGAMLLAGCSLSTDNANRPAVSIQYFLLETPPPPGAPPTIAITTGPRFVQVEGQVVAPCPTARGDVRHQVTGDEIAIRIIFSTAASCTGGLPLRYVASLVSVRPGTYDLTVIHEGDTQVATGTAVYDAPVTIPDVVTP